jgi:nicotinate dehydrogenase subunit B
MITLNVNGTRRSVKASPDTPLLYVLRNELGVMTPKFGCGMAQCGACSVLLGDQEIRACITPISALQGKEITTVEGLPARWARQKKAAPADCGRRIAPRSGSLDRGAGAPVRHLPVRHDDQGHRTARSQSRADGRGYQGSADHFRPLSTSVPLRQLCSDPGWRKASGGADARRRIMSAMDSLSIHGAKLSRREVLQAGGALIVSFSLVPAANPAADPASTGRSSGSLDAARLGSWIEIRDDNSILLRTGKCDFGQSSIYTAYRQIVAEELGLPVEHITTVVAGDTDSTPDGGGTFGLLRGAQSLRKAAAYSREAMLELAARKFGVARESLSIRDGVISGGGQSATFGKLVADADLRLTIPVRGDLTSFFGLQVIGDPPLKPSSTYTIVGQSIKNPILRPKVSGESVWVGDVKLPGMLHGRVVHPATLGSTLVSAGKLNRPRFPTAKVVVIGNLVGVVAEDEWEAVRAAQAVAAGTKWSDWKGLPTHGKLAEHLSKKVNWDELPATKSPASKGEAAAGSKASTRHEASYFFPYMKHAPISPTVSLADVKADGSVVLHTHSQNPQFLRSGIATMMGKPLSDVVVRTYPGSGHYGRSNGGNAGSEDEAVLLSRAAGRPVRVQWDARR